MFFPWRFRHPQLSLIIPSRTAAAQLWPDKPLKTVSRNRETHCLASPDKIMRQLRGKSPVSTLSFQKLSPSGVWVRSGGFIVNQRPPSSWGAHNFVVVLSYLQGAVLQFLVFQGFVVLRLSLITWNLQYVQCKLTALDEPSLYLGWIPSLLSHEAAKSFYDEQSLKLQWE